MPARLLVHESQFPEHVQRELLLSLRSRRIPNKFHYDTYKQAAQWLALHEACSPARADPRGRALYETAFHEVADLIPGGSIDLVGLCIGNGWKEAQLLKALRARGLERFFFGSDSSLPLLLLARQAALEIIPENDCQICLADFEGGSQWAQIISEMPRGSGVRLFTLFGALHNFEPDFVSGQLRRLVGPSDLLLASLNLGRAEDYEASLQAARGEYDNQMTRDWLETFLRDLGVARSDGTIEVLAEKGAGGLGRIAVYFRLARSCRLQMSGQPIEWLAGQSVRLFFSYRYTPKIFHELCAAIGLRVLKHWHYSSEGLFLCRTA